MALSFVSVIRGVNVISCYVVMVFGVKKMNILREARLTRLKLDVYNI
jgi:hypothetical protein